MSQLTDQILAHIYHSLGIGALTNISILSDAFLIPRKISFNIDGEEKIANLWGAQITIDNLNFRILCGDFSSEIKEFALVIKLDNCPTYGCYLSFCEMNDNHFTNPSDGMILFSFKDNHWLISNTYVQATFLAGMEQLKDVGAAWQSLVKYDDLIDNIKTLVEYHDNSFELGEDANEG